GSIVALLALAPQGHHLGVIAGVVVATVVSFIIAALILKTGKETEEELTEATDKVEKMKGKKSASTEVVQDGNKGINSNKKTVNEKEQDKNMSETVNKVIFACDAGMGSSAMGASLLKKKFEKENIDINVSNSAINQIPDDADVV